MTYKCECCKSIFTSPLVSRVRENLDGEHGWQTRTELYCPVCGSEDINEVQYVRDQLLP